MTVKNTILALGLISLVNCPSDAGLERNLDSTIIKNSPSFSTRLKLSGCTYSDTNGNGIADKAICLVDGGEAEIRYEGKTKNRNNYSPLGEPINNPSNPNEWKAYFF